MKIVSRRHEPIASIGDWETHGRPAKPEHWVSGRSAFELARAWIDGEGLDKLVDLLALDTSGSLADFDAEIAIAEEQTAFDEWPGGKRNHDLLVFGSARGRRTVVSIEGKADETFGQTLARYRKAAERRRNRGEATNALRRLDGLTRALAGATVTDRPDLLDLRYQLFSGVAGVLAATDQAGASQAAFVIHEFETDRTDPELQAKNAGDLARFLETLAKRTPPASEATWLVGPLTVPGGERIPGSIPLWIGHIRTHSHERGAGPTS